METKFFYSSGFSHHWSPEELYVSTRHWLLDIAFFEREITFFQLLIDDFFVPLITIPPEEYLYDIRNQLADLLKRKELLKHHILTHQNELSTILDKNQKEEQTKLNSIQFNLEGEFFDFIKSFRKTKQQLFTVTEIHKMTLLHKA